MKLSTVIDKIDSGAIALPEFQRGYVWSRRQVRELVESLYRRFPVGSLLLWETATESAPAARGTAALQPGFVALLLDGQQRVTSLYGLIRGTPPPFFDGNPRAFTDLRFNIETEQFAFYAPVTMGDDPRWLDVGEVMREGFAPAMSRLDPILATDEDEASARRQRYMQRLNDLYLIRDLELHEEEITGPDKTVDVVVDLFNRVNASGTKLSKGDLALARVCASWPQARDEFKSRLARWSERGFDFKLEWLLRNVNAIVTEKAEFAALDDVEPADLRDGVERADRAINAFLNLVSSRLGLDHDRVLGAVGAIPAISYYLAARDCRVPDARTADRLLFWYVSCVLWGRYSGSTETVLNLDLQRLKPPPEGDESDEAPIDRLIAEAERQRTDWRVTDRDFEGWSRGARFYPLLYMLSRVCHARDLGSGLELSAHMLGRHTDLEVHHLFPKAMLYRHDYPRSEVNALANFAFVTLETNRSLGDRAPADYLAECERRQPGVLASQWIPEDPDLWVPGRFPDFLAARRALLASAATALLDDLRTGRRPEGMEAAVIERGRPPAVEQDDEGVTVSRVRDAMEERGLQRGVEHYALLSMDGAVEEAVLDLAWPDGLEFGGEKLALLLNEPATVGATADDHGFRVITSEAELLRYADGALTTDGG